MIDYFLIILMVLSAVLFLFVMVSFILAPKFAKKELFINYYGGTGAIYHGFKLFKVKSYREDKVWVCKAIKYSSIAIVVMFFIMVIFNKIEWSSTELGVGSCFPFVDYG